MFRRIFGTDNDAVADATAASMTQAETTTGDTATVRRIVAKLEAMPPERARLVASAAYTLARAAHADLDISPEETAIIEEALQERGQLDEPTAVLVAEMAKFQANTVGGTEDYVVTREFAQLATTEQKEAMLRACFVISAANGSISAEESAEVNQIAKELDLDPSVVSAIRADFHDRLTSVQAVRRIAEQG
jgi:tellurite resistance protein